MWLCEVGWLSQEIDLVHMLDLPKCVGTNTLAGCPLCRLLFPDFQQFFSSPVCILFLIRMLLLFLLFSKLILILRFEKKEKRKSRDDLR